MEIERFYLGCLAHASYLIHDAGEAAVIDPQRDIDIYIDAAQKLGVHIRWVIETHLHADFVSGHLELARRTGAAICLGADAGAAFEHRNLHDGETIPLGGGQLRALATPGHTEESICIVASSGERPNDPLAVFTGDTLFIGDVGRPDLSPTRTPQELASLLYDSLHEKLLRLPEQTLVYPAHGAGSLCGRQMSNESSSTIGRESQTNYALQAKSREEFVELLTSDLASRPAYFQDEVERNRAGAPPIEELPDMQALSPARVAQLQDSGAIVLDTRAVMQFAAAHIPKSIHIALDGQFASWAARLLGVNTALILVAEDDEALRQSRTRLARVGLESVIGFLAGGIAAWAADGRELQPLIQISAQELGKWLHSESSAGVISGGVVSAGIVIDVRNTSERLAGAIPGSISMPLDQLQRRLSEIDGRSTVFVNCKGGYRSSIGASILQSAGFSNVVNLTGGYDAWRLAWPDGVKVLS
jgi:hydroxyacylglutathione hydrolase